MNKTAGRNSSNKWTLMFFFAGDNTLSPSMVSQLKAIKDAGYQKNTSVLVRFDPNESGTPTMIFDVNREQKKGIRKTRIGDGKNSFVRNLREDEVNATHIESRGVASRAIKAQMKAPEESDFIDADEALDTFLSFCRENHPAEHYMLFLVGHGMIVGSDAFLPDDRPDTAISLKQLGTILDDFTKGIKGKGALELVGMHSCSMSAVEVAYELKGTANYLMATEGTSFVGSWPYRQLLKKIFNTVESKKGEGSFNIPALLRPLINCCLHNSTDFMFAGYSADLCLCNLNTDIVKEIDAPMRMLTRALKAGLKTERGRELILLAHWEAQSYWQENYTDLYDFCHCLGRSCEADVAKLKAKKTRGKEEQKPDEKIEPRESIIAACKAMTDKLDPPKQPGKSEKLTATEKLKKSFERLVVFFDFFGPTYQYSHGLSVYFPWSRPIDEGAGSVARRKTQNRLREDKDDSKQSKSVMEKYEKYAFTEELDDDSWFSFLEDYFNSTRRKSREREDGIDEEREGSSVVNRANTTASGEGLPGSDDKSNPRLARGKTSPADSGGGTCGCGSIKNYPQVFSRSERVQKYLSGQKSARPSRRRGGRQSGW